MSGCQGSDSVCSAKGAEWVLAFGFLVVTCIERRGGSEQGQAKKSRVGWAGRDLALPASV